MNSKLYVGNLAPSVDDARLREAFSTHGTVLDGRVVADCESGESRGFGFVEYSSEAEGRSAVEAMNGLDLDGQPVNVKLTRSGDARSTTVGPTAPVVAKRQKREAATKTATRGVRTSLPVPPRR